MNVTGVIICDTCQTSNGFSSTEQRSIIVMVVLTSIALVLCYVGVLWYAIRTRFILDKDSKVIAGNTVHHNEAFNNEEEQDEEYEQPMDNTRRPEATTTQHVRFEVENESIQP